MTAHTVNGLMKLIGSAIFLVSKEREAEIRAYAAALAAPPAGFALVQTQEADDAQKE